MATFLVVQPENRSITSRTTIRLFDEVAPFSLGRSPEAWILLHSVSISRRHAEVRVNQGRLSIRDIGSTNGLRTRLNDPLQPFVWVELNSSGPIELIGYLLWKESERPVDQATYACLPPQSVLQLLPGPGVQTRLAEIEALLTRPNTLLGRYSSRFPLPSLPEFIRPEMLAGSLQFPPVGARLRLLLEETEILATESDLLGQVFRDLLGDFYLDAPLCPAVSAWRDGLVPCMARTMEHERRYQDLPILADALEEAGCEVAEVLEHLRGPGPHFPGCWALRWLTARPCLVPLLQ